MAKKRVSPTLVAGEKSVKLATRSVSLAVTVVGGMVGPVRFKLPGRTISPLHVAPWHNEKLRSLPPILRVLRGDFFCLPFGGNETKVAGKHIPIHGETANAAWKLDDSDRQSVAMSLPTRLPKGLVRKRVWASPGQTCVYQTHELSGFTGRVSFGHHLMVRFDPEWGEARISTSRLFRGQVFPGQFEKPELGGYSCLKPGARFESLARVPRADGTLADLTRYPAREGFEDLVMVSSDPREPLAWAAVAFPQARFAVVTLKNPAVLASTVLWHSNGGRHYAPWNSRHRRVLGVEDVTANFHFGHAESTAESDVTRDGVRTWHDLSPRKPLVVGYIFACVPLPAGFDEVDDIHEAAGGVVLMSKSGPTQGLPVDLGVLG
jgi:hypothetical protein